MDVDERGSGSAPATGAADCALAVCSRPSQRSDQFSVFSPKVGRVCPHRAGANRFATELTENHSLASPLGGEGRGEEASREV